MTEKQKQTAGDGDQSERRQTPTERYHELALQAAQRQPVQAEHSLDLTRNAKGDIQIALTVRGADLDQVEAEAVASFDRLCDRYPRAESTDAEEQAKRLGNAARIHAARARKE
jgi:hypothetical protein